MKKFYLISIILISMSGLSLTLVIEFGLRKFYFNSSKSYYTWSPGLRFQLNPDPKILHGIRGISQFSTNQMGLRADERTSEHTLSILTLGGSTVEDFYLDQKETWSYLLQQRLGAKVWVGNAGKSGLTSNDHVIQSKLLNQQIPALNYLVVLLGLNDLVHYLQAAGNEWRSSDNPDLVHRAFDIVPQSFHLWPLEKTALYALAKRAYKRVRYQFMGLVFDSSGKHYLKLRQKRKNGLKRKRLNKSLQPLLKQLTQNILKLQKTAEHSSKRILFLTQPTLWHKDLSKQESASLWFGQLHDKTYLSHFALAHLMRQVNQHLLKICQKHKLFCFDLANQIPKNLKHFYDDCHFNEQGAKLVASKVAQQIMADLKRSTDKN